MSIFMSFDGIKGESSDKNHKGWIDLESIGWGVNRKISSNSSTQGDRESSNAIITDLTIQKHMDSATPGFFLEACCGKGKTVIIHHTKTGSGSGSDIFMEYTLTHALVSHYQVESESHSEERPIEKMVISFTKIEAKYTSYDDDGNAESPLVTGFDTATNTRK